MTAPLASRSGRRPTGQPQLVTRAVRPDAQMRVSLKKAIAAVGEVESFDVYICADSSIVLQPKVSVPAAEAWLFKNPEALASVRRGAEQAAAGDLHDLGSFARYVDEK